MRSLAAFSIAFACQSALAQDPFLDLRVQIEQQRAESLAKLRQAIIDLRGARQRACSFRQSSDCLLVELSTAELTLLNIEDTYRQAENRTASDVRRARYKKIRELADELRSRVDELGDLIDASER